MHQEQRINATPLSHLTDDEFVRHLMSKTEPTPEDIEAMHRLEQMMGSYSSLLETIHIKTQDALGDSSQTRAALQDIQDLTAPAHSLVCN